LLCYAVRKLDLPITFHGLRHVHASLLLREGVHPKIVSERLGHSGVGLTLDTYSHLMPTMQREAANQLNTSLTQAIGQFQKSKYGQDMDKPAKSGNPS